MSLIPRPCLGSGISDMAVGRHPPPTYATVECALPGRKRKGKGEEAGTVGWTTEDHRRRSARRGTMPGRSACGGSETQTSNIERPTSNIEVPDVGRSAFDVRRSSAKGRGVPLDRRSAWAKTARAAAFPYAMSPWADVRTRSLGPDSAHRQTTRPCEILQAYAYAFRSRGGDAEPIRDGPGRAAAS